MCFALLVGEGELLLLLLLRGLHDGGDGGVCRVIHGVSQLCHRLRIAFLGIDDEEGVLDDVVFLRPTAPFSSIPPIHTEL